MEQYIGGASWQIHRLMENAESRQPRKTPLKGLKYATDLLEALDHSRL